VIEVEGDGTETGLVELLGRHRLGYLPVDPINQIEISGVRFWVVRQSQCNNRRRASGPDVQTPALNVQSGSSGQSTG
jgi:hypothetical protein